MGNARSSLDSLLYFRAWTAAEVAEVQDTLRRRKATLSVDRATFDMLVGVQNRDSVQVFDALDSDYDGLVDTFEVLLTLTLWSCASWEEKLDLMFHCFDFNQKGALRFPEVALMISTAARVLGRFADLPAWTGDAGALRDAALAAFGGLQDSELKSDAFCTWFGSSDVAQQLRDFVDASLSQETPEAVEALVRERVRLLEYRVQELSHEVAQLRETATATRNEAAACSQEHQKRAKTLWEKLDGIFALLASAEEAQRSELRELAEELTREVSADGLRALLEPSARSRHGRLIAEIDALERRARIHMEQAKTVLGELLELSVDEEEHFPEALLPPLPPGSPVDSADPEAVSRRSRLLDREMRRRRGRQPVEAAALALKQESLPQSEVGSTSERRAPSGTASPLAPLLAAEVANTDLVAVSPDGSVGGVGRATPDTAEQPREETQPVVVAFAPFQPPPSNETLMLTLEPGDEIVALGQDGQGWWYGRKVATGQEGWFPPSYVQLKEEYTATVARARS